MSACPASDAEKMRSEVKQMVAQGQSKEEIMNYFSSTYGQKILAEPPKTGFFLSAWIMPIVGFVIGLGIVFLFIGRRKNPVLSSNAGDIVSTDIPDKDIDEEMKKYL